jgi:hypothetical protein
MAGILLSSMSWMIWLAIAMMINACQKQSGMQSISVVRGTGSVASLELTEAAPIFVPQPASEVPSIHPSSNPQVRASSDHTQTIKPAGHVVKSDTSSTSVPKNQVEGSRKGTECDFEKISVEHCVYDIKNY